MELRHKVGVAALVAFVLLITWGPIWGPERPGAWLEAHEYEGDFLAYVEPSSGEAYYVPVRLVADVVPPEEERAYWVSWFMLPDGRRVELEEGSVWPYVRQAVVDVKGGRWTIELTDRPATMAGPDRPRSE